LELKFFILPSTWIGQNNIMVPKNLVFNRVSNKGGCKIECFIIVTYGHFFLGTLCSNAYGHKYIFDNND